MNESSRKKIKNKTSRTTTQTTNRGKTQKTCRACLKKGKMPINKNNISCDLLLSVRIFGDVMIEEDDPFPKYLCEACYSLLQNAIKFRETAQYSDKLLRQRLKQEDSMESSIINDYARCSPEYDNPELLIDEDNEIKTTEILAFDVKIEENECNPIIKQNAEIRPRKAIQKVQCDLCKKSISKYYYKDHLTLHEHGHGTPKQKVKAYCKICNKSLEKSYFKQHMSTVHEKEPSKYVCFICGKVFRFQSGYKSHILSHSNEFPYKCEHCPYKGRHSGLLKTHMRVHERNYKFQCSDCAAQFLTSGNLNKHMLKHKEKKFNCDACTRAFHLKTDLDKHFQVDHLGIKSHICSICDKAFGYRKAMMKHMSKIHKRAKQQCGRLPSYLQSSES